MKKYKCFKILFTSFLLLLALKTLAPEVNGIYVYYSGPVKPYDRIINAVIHIESLGNTLAYNMLEEAAGAFQIRPIRLLDYNQRTNKNYKLNDRFNFEISKEIFLYYAKLIGFNDYETIAKNWNGSGKATPIYWEKVKLHL